MFKCDYRKLRLTFNEFHNIVQGDMPIYDEFCLLKLKNGDYTAGRWSPDDCDDTGNTATGKFIRGFCDSIPVDEVEKWHSLRRNDLSNCLEREEVNVINLGVEEEDICSVRFKDFKSFSDNDFPKSKQYCLLIFKDGRMGAGRWDFSRDKNSGWFSYASAGGSYNMDKVWAWTALSPDDFFNRERDKENERRHEEELNRNPSFDEEKFKYGKDVNAYYEKALEKLRKEFPWASIAQMKKNKSWDIVPLHGQYVFGQVGREYDGYRTVDEWTGGKTADEFIDFLYDHSKDIVKNSDPKEKFKYGYDIEVYLQKAYDNVKKDCRWLEKEMLGKNWHYRIEQVDGDWEFVRVSKDDGAVSVYETKGADSFIKCLQDEFLSEALIANPVVKEYDVPFGKVDLFGWGLERYTVSKLKSGDYKVNVTAGNRSAGGSREFFITPYCFEAKTYDEFLDRYQEIIPGSHFGLTKEDLISNSEFKSFMGY